MPFDLDVSPDGKLVSLSMAGPDGERSGVQVMQLRVMSAEKLMAGDPTPLHKFELGTALPEGFTFSPDGRYLYGSSYYTGVSNIYRYELATEKLEALSNAEVGFFRPVPLDDKRLIVFHYAARGLRASHDRAPAHRRPERDHASSARQIATTHPSRAAVGRRSAEPGRLPGAVSVARAPYHPQREMSLESLVPIVEGYKDSVAFGAFARFSDPIGFDNVNLTVSYSPDDELAVRRAAARVADLQALPVDSRACAGIRLISSTCSVRPSAATRGTAASSPTSIRCSTSRRRR